MKSSHFFSKAILATAALLLSTSIYASAIDMNSHTVVKKHHTKSAIHLLSSTGYLTASGCGCRSTGE